jgi:uncharacterized protein (DUF1330 family)
MAVYVVSEVAVLDEETAQRYRDLAALSIDEFGGRYLVRGAVPSMLEGDWDPAERVVIVEFPSENAARAWYDSPEYAAALAVRDGALRRRLLLVPGV